jgi:type VII secretion integral membrane protein EccD
MKARRVLERMHDVSENAPTPERGGPENEPGGGLTPPEGGAVAIAGADAAIAVASPPATTDDLCRLTVCGPSRSVELAVPAHVPLIDLLPALLGHLGDGLADAGVEHDGWVLQRLGDPPLREDLSVAALGLHDGDMVHLRPRAAQLPPLDFDDLVDGIAVGISGRADRWRPEMTRSLLVTLLAVPMVAGLVLLAAHLSPLADLAAAGFAVVFLALMVAARSFADMPATAMLGAGTITYAGLAAAELPLLHAQAHGQQLLTWALLRAALLAAGAAVTGASGAVAIVVGGRRPVLAGIVIAALLATAAGAVGTFGHLSLVGVAALTLVAVMPVGSHVPMLSFRLAGLHLDPLPTSPGELQADLDPVPGQYVLESTRRADHFMTALYCGLAVVTVCGLGVLGVSGGLRADIVAIDAIVLLLLHSRSLVAARHRLPAVIPAVAGLAMLLTAYGVHARDDRSWLPLLAVVVVAVALLFIAERSLPGRRMLPHWGRVGDLLHTLTASALLPLALWVLNLYSFVRAAHG